MTSKRSVVVSFFSTFITTILLFLICYNCFTYLLCYSVSKKVQMPREQEFLRFMIYGSSYNSEGDTVSGSISILDSNRNEIAVIERSWTGSYLSIEFDECNFAGVTYFFPKRIYGKENITETRTDRRKGTDLERYYDENGQCMLLGYGSTYRERHHLYRLAKFATKKVPVLDWGRRNTYIIDLSPCKTETYYSIRRDTFGNLVIEEL